jgi:hypothetical protein
MYQYVFYALTLLVASNALAVEPTKPKLEWCLDELPPRHYFVEGIPQGPMVVMMKKLAERAGFELTFSPPTPTSRCLLKMKNGRTDLMTGLLFSTERAAFIKLWPFDEARSAAVFIRKDTPAPNAANLVNGQTLVLAKNRVYPEILIKQLSREARLIYADDVEDALAMLLYGDADIMLGPQHVTEFAINKNKRFAGLLVLSPNQLPVSSNLVNHIGLSRYSKHIDLAPQIEQALQSLITEHKTHFYQSSSLNTAEPRNTQ